MKKTSLFALLAVAGSTSAFATVRETASFAGPIDSNGLIGSTFNAPSVTFAATGLWDDAGTPTAYGVQQLVFGGTLTTAPGGFFPNEAAVLVTPPSGTPFVISPRQGGTSPATVANAVTIPVGSVGTAGNWTFTFFELFDDAVTTSASANSVDAVWTNVTIGFDDAVPATNSQPGPQANFALTNVLADGVASAGFVTNAVTIAGSPNLTASVRVSGTATSLRGPAANTTASAVANLRFAVVNPSGTVSATVTPTFTGIGITNTNAPSSANFVATIPVPAGSENGTWTLRSFTAADIAGGPDVGMRDVTISFLPPPPPPTNTALPALVDGSFVSASGTLATGTTPIWFSFTTPAIDAASNSALDIDFVNTTTLTPGNDPRSAVYSASGSTVAINDDSGAGLLPQYSWGKGGRSGRIQGALAAGLAFSGQNGATLAAGTYYIAVTGGGTTWNANYSPVATNTNTGPVTVNARYYSSFFIAPPASVAIPALVDGGAWSTATGSIAAAGGVQWFNFTTPASLVSTGALDIDVEGSALTPANDTDIALYNGTSAALVSSDEDDGTDLLSQLSFGTGRRNATGNGARFGGLDGTVGVGNTIVPSQQYFLAVAGGNAATHATGYLTSGGVNTGPVTARVRVWDTAGPTDPVTPPASQDLGTVGDVGATENTISATWTMASAGEVKWFKVTTTVDALAAGPGYIDIDTEGTDPNPAVAATVSDLSDTYMGLWNADGTLRTFDDDGGTGFRSALTYGATTPVRPAVPTPGANAGGAPDPRDGFNGALPAGTYYVAVATYQPTYGADFGASGPTGTTAIGDRTINVRTNFSTGPAPCGLSDVAGPNQSIGADGQLTADDIIVFLSWYFGNDARADVAGQNQSTVPDDELTADDIIVFLSRYFAGC